MKRDSTTNRPNDVEREGKGKKKKKSERRTRTELDEKKRDAESAGEWTKLCKQ